MKEVRNLDGRLVCQIDDSAGTVEIKMKACTTTIKRNPDGTTEVINNKNSAA